VTSPEPPFVVVPSRGPKRHPDHDGQHFAVVDSRSGVQVGRYVTEAAAVEYAAGLNAEA
jgi:hypothetical protein